MSLWTGIKAFFARVWSKFKSLMKKLYPTIVQAFILEFLPRALILCREAQELGLPGPEKAQLVLEKIKEQAIAAGYSFANRIYMDLIDKAVIELKGALDK